MVGIFVIRNQQNADEAQIMALCDQVYLSRRRTKEIKATFERFQIVSLKDFKGNAWKIYPLISDSYLYSMGLDSRPQARPKNSTHSGFISKVIVELGSLANTLQISR